MDADPFGHWILWERDVRAPGVWEAAFAGTLDECVRVGVAITAGWMNAKDVVALPEHLKPIGRKRRKT